MLSSLFPRSSLYSHLDGNSNSHDDVDGARREGPYRDYPVTTAEQQRQQEGDLDDRHAQQETPGEEEEQDNKEDSHGGLQDPFAQEELSSKRSSHAETPASELVIEPLPAGPVDDDEEEHGDDNAARLQRDGMHTDLAQQDDGPKMHDTQAQLDPFAVETAPRPKKRQPTRMAARPSGAPHGSPAPSDQLHSHLDHEEMEQPEYRGKTQHGEDEGPPKSIMYEERSGPTSHQPWPQPTASTSQLDSQTFTNARSTVTSPAARASAQGAGRPELVPGISSNQGLPASTIHLEQSQQVPWWLRESRSRRADASAIKASIPHERHPAFQLANKGDDRDGQEHQDAYRLPQHSPPKSTTSTTTSSRSKNVFSAAADALSGRRRQGAIHLQTSLPPRERALWKWVNVEDLDTFLQDVYTFYARKGLWSIALSHFLDLLTIGFVIAFATFLLGCVDYSRLKESHKLSEVVVPRCVSSSHLSTLLIVLFFAAFYALRILRFGQLFRKLVDMRDFFTELLDIPEADIQTISWPAIVDKLSILRANHPSQPHHQPGFSTSELDSPTRLDAHDVANRIMRKENYLIALFNKSVLDLAIPVPVWLSRSRSFRYVAEKASITYTTLNKPPAPATSNPAGLTKVLEWNLTFCLLGFLFGPDGQVRRSFIQERNKGDLVQALQRRFILMGFINAIFAPFIVLYLLFYSFFRYFEEYHKNPSSIGSRSYTQLARWKFREFNELPHIFQQRLHRSYPLAESYINQFPNDRTAQIARFVAFVAGSFASVLVLFSIIDPDAILHFEVTKDRTVLFYIGIFGSILAIARGMVPDDHRVVDPEQLMRAVIEETHYLPAEWRGKLHSAEVHRDFSLLFPLRLTSFFHEVLSVLTTPLVLWFTLPRCAPAIIDFFREFTIHVDGLGYVCSFAVFDFYRHGDVRFGAPVQGKQDLVSSQGKLEKSVLNFKAANPNWQPHDQATSLYLSRMTDAASTMFQRPSATRRGPSRSSSRTNAYHPQAGQSQGVTPVTSPILEDSRQLAPSMMSTAHDRSRRTGRFANAPPPQAGRSGQKRFPQHIAVPIAEESDLGGSYVSTMENPRQGRANDDRTASPPESIVDQQEPSMIGLLLEGTKQRW